MLGGSACALAGRGHEAGFVAVLIEDFERADELFAPEAEFRQDTEYLLGHFAPIPPDTG